MRNVRNNQAVRRLAQKSFRANRTRNLVAAIAIMLTSLLFTSVFTIGLGIIKDVQRSAMKQAGGDAHGSIKNITQEQYEILSRHPLVKEHGRDIVVADSLVNPEFLKRHVEMHYLDQNMYPHWFVNIIDGKEPETAEEILMDKKSMELLGLEPKAGCQVALEMQLFPGDAPVKRSFTVSGVMEPAEGMNVGFVFVSPKYLEKYAEEIRTGSLAPSCNTGKIYMYVLFANTHGIQKKLGQVITDSGFSTDSQAPGYIESNTNWAYLSDGAEGDPVTVLGISAALALVMVTGYLIIYNIFHISIIRDIRYYGLLKTIGTTGRQIKRILRRQAVYLCIIGTPAGLLLGYLAGQILLPLIISASTQSGSQAPVSPQPWIFAGATAFTVATVLISQWKPGRIAGKVSPMEALRYTDHGKAYKKQKKTTDGGKLIRMAFSNLGRSKSSTAVVICSLSLTVVLMNSTYTITSSINRETFLSKMILCEDIIGNAALWNYKYYPLDENSAAETSLSESFISACTQQEAFADGGRIYLSITDVTMPVESWEIPDHILKTESGAPARLTPDGLTPLSGYENGGYFVDMHGIDPFVLSKMTVAEGERDTDVIWKKLQTGNYLIYGAAVDDHQLVKDEEVKHHAGDKITLRWRDGQPKEYEIISVVKKHQNSLGNRMSSNFSYYVSAEEFKENLSDVYLMSYLLDTKEGQEDAMADFLEAYTTEIEPAMSYESRQSFESAFQEMLGMFTIVGTGLTAIIGMIGLLNFVNALLTSISIRKREFAMMEAIGMTRRQLVGMLMAEGIFYSLLTAIFSLAASAAFSLTALRAAGSGIWFIHYRFVLTPVLAACPVLLVLGALIPKAVYALGGKESVVDKLRE